MSALVAARRLRLARVLILLAVSVPLSGCFYVPGPGWCAYHPYRCR